MNKEGSILHACNWITIKLIDPFKGRIPAYVYDMIISDIQKDEYTNICVTWDERYIQLYYDGRHVQEWSK